MLLLAIPKALARRRYVVDEEYKERKMSCKVRTYKLKPDIHIKESIRIPSFNGIKMYQDYGCFQDEGQESERDASHQRRSTINLVLSWFTK